MPSRLRLPPLHHAHDAEILRLAVPAFGALVAEPLFLLADSAIVGHLGTDQLAGLGIAATIIGTALSLCIFLAYGTTAAVARRIGAEDMSGALRLGVHGLWLAGVLGLLLAALGFVTADTVVAWFDPDPGVDGYAVTYMRVSMLGVPAMLGVFAMTGLLRGLQDTRTPLYVAVAANLANIVLNLALVYGAGLGIGGSALGTVIAQWGSILVYVAVVRRALIAQHVPLGWSTTGVLASFRASAPLFVRNVAIRSTVLMAAVVAARMGSTEIAAHQVAFAVWTALALGLDAIAIAGQALVGRYLGASDIGGARDATRRMVELSVVFGVVLGLVIFATRDLVAPLFSDDPAVQQQLVDVLVVIAVIQPAAGWVFALDGVLIGAGDARFLAVAQTLCAVAFVPLAAFVLAMDLGLEALWWALALWVLSRLFLLTRRASTDAWAVAGASR
jgi:putative MATE family efflux protein